MKVCVGGTFDVVHRGHRRLLERAFREADHVYIGLASDALASSAREDAVRPYSERERELMAAIDKSGLGGDYTVLPLKDRFGPAAIESYDAIVVSTETALTATELNEARKKNGLEPLEVIEVAKVLAADGLPISSTRVRANEIDTEGKLLGTVRLAVGTANRVKADAVLAVFERIFGDVAVDVVPVSSGVPEQPRDGQTVEGAINRARSAVKQGDHSFGVGIEAGLFVVEGKCLDVQYCAVADRGGRLTLGCGPGFAYPPGLVSLLEEGLTVSEAVERLYGIEDIGSKMGAVGFFSDGLLDRTGLTEQAVLAAMIPRIREELYE